MVIFLATDMTEMIRQHVAQSGSEFLYNLLLHYHFDNSIIAIIKMIIK